MIDRLFTISSPSKPSKKPSVRSGIKKTADKKRIGSLSLHVKTGDYFMYLSTLFGFVEETLASETIAQPLTSMELEAVRAIREDLQYLNCNYRIEPRR
jgi:hypothetical protein